MKRRQEEDQNKSKQKRNEKKLEKLRKMTLVKTSFLQVGTYNVFPSKKILIEYCLNMKTDCIKL